MKAEVKERIAMIERGEAPEGYKKSRIGIIPKQWGSKTGKNLFDHIRNGFVGVATPFYVENGVKYLQGNNVKNGRIQSTEVVFISEDFHLKHEKSQLKKDDIVMVQSGHVGECAVISEEYEGANCHALIILTPRDDIESKFYANIFGSDFGKKIIYKITTGNIIKHILASDMKEVELPLPSIAEQRIIGSTLLLWDNAIDLKEKLLEQKKLQKKGLMERLSTGKVRLAGFTGKWQFVKLRKIAKRITKTSKSTQVPVLTISSLSGFLLQSERFSKVIAGENIAKYTYIQKNDFAYNKGNSKTYPYGCIFQLEDYDEALIPNVYYSFKIEGHNSTFYKYYFESGILNHQLHRVINTGVRNDGLLNLDVDDFFKVGVHVPPPEEQEKIAEIFTAFDVEINLLMEELKQLKAQKKGLMQLLLTGKVRVSC